MLRGKPPRHGWGTHRVGGAGEGERKRGRVERGRVERGQERAVEEKTESGFYFLRGVSDPFFGILDPEVLEPE